MFSSSLKQSIVSDIKTVLGTVRKVCGGSDVISITILYYAVLLWWVDYWIVFLITPVVSCGVGWYILYRTGTDNCMKMFSLPGGLHPNTFPCWGVKAYASQATRGGEGVKNPTFRAYVLCRWLLLQYKSLNISLHKFGWCETLCMWGNGKR